MAIVHDEAPPCLHDAETADDNSFLPPDYPEIRPRPGSKTFVVATSDVGRCVLCRIGLTLDKVIDDEVQDWKNSNGWYRERELDPATEQDDRAIWEGNRLMALVRPGPDGEPEVIRLDDEDEAITSNDSPPPDDAIAREITIRAIEHYEETRAAYLREGNGDWNGAARYAMASAEKALMVNLLTWPSCTDPKFILESRRISTHMRPRGFVHGDKLYLATGDHDEPLDTEEPPPGKGGWAMRLTVVDLEMIQGLN